MDSKDRKDKLYSDSQSEIEKFVFDDKVAGVFGDMITRSVPGYADIVQMIGLLAKEYVKPHTHIYDLGASLGAVTHAIRANVDARSARVIAVDNSESMMERCRKNLAAQSSPLEVDLRCEDILETQFENASFVILNFTLQFIAPEARESLLKRIASALVPGGVLILSEKIAFDQASENEFQIDLHHTFKKLFGYSDLEISQKRTALENVLIPETLGVHKARLGEAGFKRTYLWFQCFNFASLISFK